MHLCNSQSPPATGSGTPCGWRSNTSAERGNHLTRRSRPRWQKPRSAHSFLLSLSSLVSHRPPTHLIIVWYQHNNSYPPCRHQHKDGVVAPLKIQLHRLVLRPDRSLLAVRLFKQPPVPRDVHWLGEPHPLRPPFFSNHPRRREITMPRLQMNAWPMPAQR